MTDPKHPDNKGKIPTKAITGNPPHADKAGFRKSYCDAPKTKSVLPKEFWTLNIHAVEGAVNDSYKYNPWRAPGSAPVVCVPFDPPTRLPRSLADRCLFVRSDPCGQAGGKYLQTPMGGDSTFKTVSVPGDKTYKMGDLGSKVLPEHPDAVTTWKIGTTPRVAWGMRYNQ